MPGKIYLFSNVEYPRNHRLSVSGADTLVFLNKAKSLDYYPKHPDRVIYHRLPDFRVFGEEVLCVRNRYVFKAGLLGIPSWFTDRIDEEYDHGDNNEMDPTTGYIVAKWLAHDNQTREVVLVNFGYGVLKSTWRSPGHNWEFENYDLSGFHHLYTE